MRMRFGIDDETAFETRRDELGEHFARWLNESDRSVPADPNDAGLLMDWKFGYGDGALDRWTLADVEEFLFGWCPRKLSAAGEDCVVIPQSVAAFVEFLADAGLLIQGSARPPDVRRFCERRGAAFVEEMDDPANFGMAKSLFAAAGGLELDGNHDPDEMDALLERMQEIAPDALRDFLMPDAEPPTIGPVRMPGADERLAAIRAADALRQLRALAEHCPSPGRQLTAKGNLRVADARLLVDALGTGDDPEQDGYGPVRSARELPRLDHLVHIALAAGVVRRHRGRLVAVGRFATLDEVTAHERVVRGAVEIGLSGMRYSAGDSGEVQDGVEACLPALLGELLDAGPAGIEVEALADLTTHLVTETAVQIGELLVGMIPRWVEKQLETLAQLGLVTLVDAGVDCRDCGETHHRAALTAAGVPIAVDLVREAGIPVLVRPDPAAATAAEITDLIGEIEPHEWHADARAWFAAQADQATAACELVAEITGEHRDGLVVLLGLNAVPDVVGEHARPAIRARESSPHGGLVLHWLLEQGAIDPETVDPDRIAASWIDVLAATLDLVGPAEMVSGLVDDQALSRTLDELWRLDHPRLAEVLEAIGTHHTDKAVAKAARRALMKHQSR
jgi:hypothetical protein